MKEQVTFKSFFSTIGRGIAQVFQWLLKITGLKGSTKYTRLLRVIVGTCITIWLAVGTIAMIYAVFENQIDAFIARNITGDTYYDDIRLSANVYLQDSWEDNYSRVYNYATDETTIKKVDWVVKSLDNDSLAVFSKNGKRGYLNRFTGEIAIPAQYDKAWVFSEGIAAVVKDSELYFIDHSGEAILRGEWAYYPMDVVFKNGYCVLWNGKEHGFGLIDTTGTWIVEPSYDDITYNNNCWIVNIDSQYGILNAQFETILPMEFEDIYIQDDMVYAQPCNAPQRQYNINGNLINDCVIDEVYTMYYEVGNVSQREDDEYGTSYYNRPVYELSSCYKYRVSIGGYDYKYGLMSQNGERITEPIYSDIESLGTDLYLCKPQGIVINSHGKQIN